MPIKIVYAQLSALKFFSTCLLAKLTMGLISYCTVMLCLSFSQCTEMDLNKGSNHIIHLDTDAQNLQLTNGRLANIYCHLFGTYMNVFYKTEVQMVILRCSTRQNLNWIKSFDKKQKKVLYLFFTICKTKN